ncbi:hypothetical protein NSPZN2_10229 [Nitrospira defluvii]|uniref:Uncharacterized protein n=1 Tax=Nitrospira defluvii TaxID=330214 RepID=A0ABM8QDD1_9BACT|nr:hypothetical protein NSPZN2_10229 [Nitrospira defluvii]
MVPGQVIVRRLTAWAVPDLPQQAGLSRALMQASVADQSPARHRRLLPLRPIPLVLHRPSAPTHFIA